MSQLQELPWSCEAEQSVLGCLLLDNIALDAVAGQLDASSFWLESHRTIFEAIKRLILVSKAADVITVHQALADAGRAEDVGGIAYLNSLAQSVASAINVRRYAEIVADKAARRAILAAADRIPALVHGADSADEAIDRVESLLVGLKRAQVGKEPRDVAGLMVEYIDRLQELAEGARSPGISTGLPQLDEALGGGIKPGKVITLAARPSVGKSSLSYQVALHASMQGHPVLILSQEMGGSELMGRALAHLGSIPLDRLTVGRLSDEDWGHVSTAVDQARSLSLLIDDQSALTLLDIRAKARQARRRAGGLDLLVLDYLQLCAGTGGNEKRHHQIEQISRGLKALAKELNVCVLLLSQLNRSSEGGEPELHHLKESGSIEEDADTVILLHPMGKEPDGTLLIMAKVAKNRGGRRGRFTLLFNGQTQTWRPSNGNVSRRSGGQP